MDDHFWPSVYPGIIIGFLLGLSEQTLLTTFLGAIGGLVGAFFIFYLLTYLEIDQGIFPVGAVIMGAAVLAKFCMWIGVKIKKEIF